MKTLSQKECVKMNPIINVSELKKIYKLENVIIVDARNGKDARENYNNKHLNEAIFVCMEKQLAEANEDLSNGGRHPLPKIKSFADTLSNIGISNDSHVIIYDDKNGINASARFWWMLKAVGHEKVQVLNGGFQEAERQNFPINSQITTRNKVSQYHVENWKLNIVDIKEVEEVSKNRKTIIVDVRNAERYNGEYEPIDLVAGHIPNAINIPVQENLDQNGLFLSSEKLRKKYQDAFGNIKSEDVIFHCGSGVTACHSILAIAYANMEIPKLYIGSWSEWSRNNKKIDKKLIE